MNVDQALQSFRNEASDPHEALQWALDNWDVASDRLLSRLRTIAANLANDPDDETFNDDDGFTLFYLVHLFAEKRDKRAYAPLCERLLRDKDSHAWLGDGVTVSLSGVLINLCDGDLEPIQRVIECRQADEYARGSALQAFAYLVRVENAASEDVAREYLRRLYDEAQPRGPSWLWVAWAEGAAELGFQDFGSHVAKLLSKNWISDAELSMPEFNAILAKSRTDPEKVFADNGVKPFESTIALIDSFAKSDGGGAGGNSDYDDSSRPEYDVPYVDPLRDIGRNDPCPCGSGKKYKKCCLAA